MKFQLISLSVWFVSNQVKQIMQISCKSSMFICIQKISRIPDFTHQILLSLRIQQFDWSRALASIHPSKIEKIQTALIRSSMAPSLSQDVGRGMYFLTSGGFTVENLGEGVIWGENIVFQSQGNHPIFSSVHPSQGKTACG